jgi:hypothetical protein
MWFNPRLVPGSVYVRSNQLQGSQITDEQVREHLRLLGEAVIDLCQRLQGSAMGPLPLSLWGKKECNPRLRRGMPMAKKCIFPGPAVVWQRLSRAGGEPDRRRLSKAAVQGRRAGESPV